MDSIQIDFNQIAWDNKSAGMRVKRFLGHGKQMRLVEIEPDSGEANWCDDMCVSAGAETQVVSLVFMLLSIIPLVSKFPSNTTRLNAPALRRVQRTSVRSRV